MRMKKCFPAVIAIALISVLFSAGRSEGSRIDSETCFACHTEVKELWGEGKHKGKLLCSQCHTGLEEHLGQPQEKKPETNVDPNYCGQCHKNQFQTFFKENLKKPARTEKSLLTGRSPNPLWDKLMMGHGFTKEHNTPRSHGYMLIDHLVVDRAYGGRFQPKNGWYYPIVKTFSKAWDVLKDQFPDQKEHKSFFPETAAASNPNCLKCKTTDNILKWKYMGDKDPKAKWDRTSNVVEYVKELQNPVGCIACHDPHATKPRIVQDGLIHALTRPEKDTLWHHDSKHGNMKVVDFRDGFRKIAILDKPDAKLQCGQCHVEYNCNPGFNIKTGEKIGFSDLRTNHFPLKDVFQIYDHYNNLEFRDFKHALTGGMLVKLQHPETETFWNSKHDKAGVSCNHCHMPKIKGKDGKTFTSHWQTSSRNYIKETCLQCHPKWTAEQSVYLIDSIQNHIKGKLRKSEFWISQLIDKIQEAKKAGIDESYIKEAQSHHDQAHILWEWWTAENSDGFHNPEQAKESLAKSIEESKKGIELLTKAIAEKK